MATEYIEKEAALKAVCDACDIIPERGRENCQYKVDGCKEYYNVFVLPPADVKPVVHDRWEKVEFDDGYGPYYLYEHKKCGCVMARKRNYCPDCGAEMDGEQDG